MEEGRKTSSFFKIYENLFASFYGLRPRVQERFRAQVSIVFVRTLRMLEGHRTEVLSCTRCWPETPGTTATGSTGVVTRLPFAGPAGKRLMGWFERVEMSREGIHLSAIARCFPGKARGGGDLVPSRAMIRNCRPHLTREIHLSRQKLKGRSAASL